MRYIAIGILLIALTSCAESYYVKPGATVADFDVDKEDCVKKASNTSMAAGYGTYRRNRAPSAATKATAIALVPSWCQNTLMHYDP